MQVELTDSISLHNTFGGRDYDHDEEIKRGLVRIEINGEEETVEVDKLIKALELFK